MALIKCPDCGRQVSDLAPACVGCGRPIAAIAAAPPPTATTLRGPDTGMGAPRAPAGILRSNLADRAPSAPSHTAAGFPTAIVLLGLLVVIAAAAAVLIVTAGRPGAPQPAGSTSTASTAAPRTPLPAIAANPRTTTAASAPPPDVNGVPCDALESTTFHIHIHLAIFVDGQEQQVPAGVGIVKPWTVEDSSVGPFITQGSCFYWIHTHTEDGVIHIESPVRRRFTLGDFFAIWQLPLSPTQVGPAQGAVIAYVNGSRDDTSPSDIPLLAHERIQLDIGGDVPPYVFDFRPGD